MTVNGSSAIMNCSNVGRTTTCFIDNPTSSVLFNDPRGMPILSGVGVEGRMWAYQLLTLMTNACSIDLTFKFHNPVRVERVEVVMFNCPKWEIGVQTIRVLQQSTRDIIIQNNSIGYSCNSLVRVSLPSRRDNIRGLTLQFILASGSDWVHLAEVTFWVSNIATVPPASSATTDNSTLTLPSSTFETLETVASANITFTTTTVPTLPREVSSGVTVIVIVTIIFFLLLVGVVVFVLVLWRCRHQHTAKEEASHTSSQTHTHPVFSLCEETGQVQYVSQQQDTDQDSLYSSIPPQVGQERKEVSKDDIVHTEEDETGGYDVIPFMLKPLEEGEKEPMVNSDNYALLKDVSTAPQKMETQFDYT